MINLLVHTTSFTSVLFCFQDLFRRDVGLLVSDQLKKNEICLKLILKTFVVGNTFSSLTLLEPQVVEDTQESFSFSESADNLRKKYRLWNTLDSSRIKENKISSAKHWGGLTVH